MRPIVTPEEMARVDAAAAEPVEVLIGRAGAAVARAAESMLGGTYGRRVQVIAGPGNNGADGLVAAERLRRRGVAVTVYPAAEAPTVLPEADLVIDAAFGTGLSRPYVAPRTGSPVLAVDIPSGVEGLTGRLLGEPLTAEVTVTFQALKPGLVQGAGAHLCGRIEVVDLGLDVSAARAHAVEDADLERVPARRFDAHKWSHAVRVVAGSPGMEGAAALVCGAAMRAGAGMVVHTPVGAPVGGLPCEVVSRPADRDRIDAVATDLNRFDCLLVGPGIGRDPTTIDEVIRLVQRAEIPLILDADGIAAVANEPSVLRSRAAECLLTPHDGEFRLLTGEMPSGDRFSAARSLARHLRAHVLLKGSPTVISDPDGEVMVSTAGDQRLATAGTGDVLSGVIAALVARGMEIGEAAAMGAWAHGRAAQTLPRVGTVASDLIPAIAAVLDR